MTTKTKAPRVRAVNLYTVECDGVAVAQAEAISQAEAIALWVASQQQPVLAARLATPSESRKLAHLPLLSRGGAVAPVDTATIDLFEVAAPVADHVEDVLKMVEPLTAGGFAPCGRALGDCGKATQTCGRDGCGVELAEMPPQHAPIAAVLEGLASGEPMPSAPSTAAPTVSPASAVAAPLQSDLLSTPAATPASHVPGQPTAAAGVATDVHEKTGGASSPTAASAEAAPHRSTAADHGYGGKVVAKYRDPATGQTWSGRGLKPRWLVQAMDEGKALEDFRIDGAKND